MFQDLADKLREIILYKTKEQNVSINVYKKCIRAKGRREFEKISSERCLSSSRKRKVATVQELSTEVKHVVSKNVHCTFQKCTNGAHGNPHSK